METVRSFIAVPMNDEIRAVVKIVEDGLRRAGADVKWVEPWNVHVTLKFLGNCAPPDLETVLARLREALTGVKTFEAVLESTGTFPPGRRNVRVVWMGVGRGLDEFRELASRVDEACAACGFEREDRPFTAHLTIGRVRERSDRVRELAEAVRSVQFNPLKLTVDRVNLLRSELSPKGPTYTVLESVPLEPS